MRLSRCVAFTAITMSFSCASWQGFLCHLTRFVTRTNTPCPAVTFYYPTLPLRLFSQNVSVLLLDSSFESRINKPVSDSTIFCRLADFVASFLSSRQKELESVKPHEPLEALEHSESLTLSESSTVLIVSNSKPTPNFTSESEHYYHESCPAKDSVSFFTDSDELPTASSLEATSNLDVCLSNHSNFNLSFSSCSNSCCAYVTTTQLDEHLHEPCESRYGQSFVDNEANSDFIGTEVDSLKPSAENLETTYIYTLLHIKNFSVVVGNSCSAFATPVLGITTYIPYEDVVFIHAQKLSLVQRIAVLLVLMTTFTVVCMVLFEDSVISFLSTGQQQINSGSKYITRTLKRIFNDTHFLLYALQHGFPKELTDHYKTIPSGLERYEKLIKGKVVVNLEVDLDEEDEEYEKGQEIQDAFKVLASYKMIGSATNQESRFNCMLIDKDEVVPHQIPEAEEQQKEQQWEQQETQVQETQQEEKEEEVENQEAQQAQQSQQEVAPRAKPKLEKQQFVDDQVESVDTDPSSKTTSAAASVVAICLDRTSILSNSNINSNVTESSISCEPESPLNHSDLTLDEIKFYAREKKDKYCIWRLMEMENNALKKLSEACLVDEVEVAEFWSEQLTMITSAN